MIFLSKGGKDPYVNMFAVACGEKPTNTDGFKLDEDSTEPLILRGILKKKIIHKCWDKQRDFYFIDTGYFGNEVTYKNPNGWKFWHRVVKNDLQHNKIISRPSDRFERFNKKFTPWKKNGSKILIAVPDEKPCKFYGIDLDEWLQNTVDRIKEYTDRPIIVRERAKERIERMKHQPLSEALKDDVFALVTYNSNAAVESIFAGIPSFVLAPSHAASPVSRTDLSEIENPYYASNDELFEWGCHLAYGMVHTSELRSGEAMEYMVNQ